MITLTKLNGQQFVLNAEHIETIENRSDTIVRLTNKEYFIVTESPHTIVSRVIAYKRSLYDVSYVPTVERDGDNEEKI